MRFSGLKLQFLLQKWIQDPLLHMGHPDYAIPVTKNYPFNNFTNNRIIDSIHVDVLI